MADFYKINIEILNQFNEVKETYVKEFESWKEELSDVMVKELEKNISKDIIEKIRNFSQNKINP